MASKRYYWFKLKETFFADLGIAGFLRTPVGCMIVIFYQKLIMKALNSEGVIRRRNNAALDVAALAAMTGTPRWVVRLALRKLAGIDKIETLADGSIRLNDIEELIGSESASAVRMRKYRDAHRDIGVAQCDEDIETDTEREKEKETEKDTETDREKEPEGDKEIVVVVNTGPERPDYNDVDEYCREAGIVTDVQAFLDYNDLRGWKAGGEAIADWRAAVRRWADSSRNEGALQKAANGLNTRWV